MLNLHRNALRLVLVSAVFLFCSISSATDYYVSTTTGSDTTGNGSQAAPWATIQHAINSVTGVTSGVV